MKTSILAAIISIIFLSSCREKIDLELNDASSKVVIEGSITNELKHHQIRVTRSLGYLDGNSAPYITNATVRLTDGNQVFDYVYTQNGIYQSQQEFSGTVNANYTLHVWVDGVEYTANEILLPVAQIDSIVVDEALYALQPGVIWEKDKIYWNIGLFSQEPESETNFYVFDAYKNGELFSDTVTKKFISDDSFINGSYIMGMYAYQVDAVPGDTLTIAMTSVSKKYFDYIIGLMNSGMSGSPFMGSPSNVSGNISNGALGYFWAGATEKMSKRAGE